MPPKRVVRDAANGVIEQQCTRCRAFRPQEEQFKSKTGKRITQICLTCRNSEKEKSEAPTQMGGLGGMEGIGEMGPPTALKRSTEYAQASPRHRHLAAAVNPFSKVHSQETMEEFTARKERESIQRNHRILDRQGMQRSQTPSMDEILNRGNEPERLSRGQGFFLCGICDVNRPLHTEVEPQPSNLCVYCQQGSQPQNRSVELKWCTFGGHEVQRHAFNRPVTGVESSDMCNPCYFQATDQEEELGNFRSQSPTFSASSFNPSRRDSLASQASDFSSMNLSASQSQQRRDSLAPRRELDTTDPPIHFDQNDNSPEAAALSEADFKLLKDFQYAMTKENTMEYCKRCKEQWFNMGILGDVCKRCRTSRDKKMKDDEPPLMSAQNMMDPGDVPAHLPKLSQVEEMLIAKVHVFMEVRQIRGMQYRYTGHICNFLRNIATVYNKLPLLPRDLDIVILKPTNTDNNAGLRRQFKKDYIVRRAAVQTWLDFLKQYHPGYADIVIDPAALAQLPIGGSVEDELTHADIDFVDEEHAIVRDEDLADFEEAPADVSAIPNLIASQTEEERLLHDAGRAPEQPRGHLTQPSFRSTPLREFNRSEPLLSLVFPTLFPRGEGEFLTTRIRSVDYATYIDHLLKYRDPRFARHPRFRYVVFNTLMRSQVNKKSTYFVNKIGSDELDLEAITAAFVNPEEPQAQALLNSIVRYASALRGTRPFWYGKKKNLETYVHALPHVATFNTFSAADLHWDSLHRAYGPVYPEWKSGTPAERIKISRAYLRDNPHIAAYHFHRRFQLIMKHVIKPKFGVTDYWNRYEFQARGSSHNHGFIWTKEAPSIDVNDAQSRDAFAQYWGLTVTAVNPIQVDGRNEERTVMSIAPDEDENTIQQLSLLVNALQRHVCTEAYCLRVPKGKPKDSQKFCRFWAPWPINDTPAVDHHRNPAHWMFNPLRNDRVMLGYNPLVTMAWKANTDVTPCTGTHAVLNYLAKYCTKEEKQTETYAEMVKKIIPFINSERPLLSLVSKTMNKLVGERDWSAQEVCHILLNIPLQEGSRAVETLDCRPQELQSAAIDFDDEGNAITGGTSKYQKYTSRPPELEHLTLFKFITLYDVYKYTARPKALPKLINYFPRYERIKAPSDYARVKLTLHLPFRSVDDLLAFDGREFMDYPSALSYFEQHFECPEAAFDGFGDFPVITEDDDDFELFEEQQTNDLFWAELAGQRPGREAATLDDDDALGNRDIDRAYDWSLHVDKHPDLVPEWLDMMKEQFPKALEVDFTSQGVVNLLNLKQRQVYDTIIAPIQAELDGLASQQLLLHVDGKAGTGKSFVINLISAHLQQSHSALGLRNPVLRAAPTGVASHGIQGRTLHSLFRLPVGVAKMKELSPGTLKSLQATLRGVKVLFIDEKSMMSLEILALLKQRLDQIFPTSDMPFGGLHIVLWGDFFQLPPVRALALFNNMSDLKSPTAVQGQVLYKLFDKTIELDVIVRQQGESLQQRQFRTALEGLRNNAVTQNDWQVLCSRVALNLTHAELSTFDDALHIYGKKVDVNEYNSTKMKALNRPVIQIKAQHTGEGAEKADWEKGGNLHKALPICLGARVMLTENRWTERGMVNGAIGTVNDINWPPGSDPYTEIPTVLVALDKYDSEEDGPHLYQDANGRYVVPVTPAKRDFQLGNVACTRKQLPLTVAYAITVHKSQGITAEKIVTNIKDRDHVVGLSYVAISRVKTLGGLLFEEPFDYSRFRVVKVSKTETMRLADYARRLPQHIPVAIPDLDDLYD